MKVHLELTKGKGAVCNNAGKKAPMTDDVMKVTCETCKMRTAYKTLLAVRSNERPGLPEGTTVVLTVPAPEEGRYNTLSFRVVSDKLEVIRGVNTGTNSEVTYTWGYLIGSQVKDMTIEFPEGYEVPRYYHRHISQESCPLISVSNQEVPERPPLPVGTGLLGKNRMGWSFRYSVLVDKGGEKIRVLNRGKVGSVLWGEFLKEASSIQIRFPEKYEIPEYYYEASNRGQIVINHKYKPEDSDSGSEEDSIFPTPEEVEPRLVVDCKGKQWRRIDTGTQFPTNETLFVNLKTSQLVKLTISEFVYKVEE